MSDTKQKKEVKAGSVTKTGSSRRTVYNKQELILGTGCIIAAIVVIFVIFYFMAKERNRVAMEYTRLQEEMFAVNTEKMALAQQANELGEQVGQSLSLEAILKEAETTYGPEEKDRKEGHLWIDRESGTLFVTLGALHGLMPGDKLTVWDNDKEVAEVRVQTPMDVVSYVRLVIKKIEDLPKDSYRVKLNK